MEEKRKSRPKSRGNGQGTAYKRPGQSTWTVEVVVGWRYPNGDITKPKVPVRKTKGGFSSKKLALDYADTLQSGESAPVRKTLEDVYLAWKTFYGPRVDESTMNCYIAAYKHFSPLHGINMDKISAEGLQGCMDACSAGKRTHQNMRTVAGLLWKYALEKDIVDKDITRNLYTGKGKSVKRQPLTQAEEDAIRDAMGKERYADYVFALIYLGFRPGEFLQLKKSQLFCGNLAEKPTDPPVPVWYFVNGKKTDAGIDRIVIVPDVILPIILARTYIPGTDLMFPQYQFDRKKEKFICFKQMSDNYFREFVFKPIMKRLGIAEGKVPYGARHTYANKLKKATGSDRDKAAIIGHSDYRFTQFAYQTSDLADLKKIVDSFDQKT